MGKFFVRFIAIATCVLAILTCAEVSQAKRRSITVNSEMSAADFRIELVDISPSGSDEFEFKITVTSPPGWDREIELGSNDVIDTVEYKLKFRAEGFDSDVLKDAEPIDFDCEDDDEFRGMYFVCDFTLRGTPELLKNSSVVIIREPRVEVLRDLGDRDSAFTSYFIEHIFPELFLSDCGITRYYLMEDPIALDVCTGATLES